MILSLYASVNCKIMCLTVGLKRVQHGGDYSFYLSFSFSWLRIINIVWETKCYTDDLNKTLKLTWYVGLLLQKESYFVGHVCGRPLLVDTRHVEAEPEPDAPTTLSFDRRHFINEGQDTLSLTKVKVQISHNEH